LDQQGQLVPPAQLVKLEQLALQETLAQLEKLAQLVRPVTLGPQVLLDPHQRSLLQYLDQPVQLENLALPVQRDQVVQIQLFLDLQALPATLVLLDRQDLRVKLVLLVLLVLLVKVFLFLALMPHTQN
jgi:hypothetical protein